MRIGTCEFPAVSSVSFETHWQVRDGAAYLAELSLVVGTATPPYGHSGGFRRITRFSCITRNRMINVPHFLCPSAEGGHWMVCQDQRGRHGVIINIAAPMICTNTRLGNTPTTRWRSHTMRPGPPPARQACVWRAAIVGPGPRQAKEVRSIPNVIKNPSVTPSFSPPLQHPAGTAEPGVCLLQCLTRPRPAPAITP